MLNKQNIIRCAIVTMATALLAACSGDDITENGGGDAGEIRLNADCWQVMKGTRAATFFDNAAQLEAETGGFMCCVYDYGTTTPYFDAVSVIYDDEEDAWKFQDGKHYWPATGALDFFAYMPATVPSYITDVSDVAGQVTYTSGTPQFKCVALPVTVSGQDAIKEFIYALTTNQDKAHQGATGVALTFKHPFARIKLQFDDYDHSNITINSITLKGIKNNGTYSHTEGWTPTGEASNFTVTTLADYNEASPFLVVPQDWGGEITVNATWTDWGEPMPHNVSTTVPTTWEPGYSYTYNLTLSKYALVVETTKYTEQW